MATKNGDNSGNNGEHDDTHGKMTQPAAVATTVTNTQWQRRTTTTTTAAARTQAEQQPFRVLSDNTDRNAIAELSQQQKEGNNNRPQQGKAKKHPPR